MNAEPPKLCPACGASLDASDRRCGCCAYTSDAALWTARALEDELPGARVAARVTAVTSGVLLVPAVALLVRALERMALTPSAVAVTGLSLASSAFFARLALDGARASSARVLWSYSNSDGTVDAWSSVDPVSSVIRIRGSCFEQGVHGFDARWDELSYDDATALALERWALDEGATSSSMMPIEDVRRWTFTALALIRLSLTGALSLVVQRSRAWSRLRIDQATALTPESIVVTLALGTGRAGDGAAFAVERALLAALDRAIPDAEPLPAGTPEAIHYRTAQIREGRVATPVASAILYELPMVAPAEGEGAPVYLSIDAVIDEAQSALEDRGEDALEPDVVLAALSQDRAVFRALHGALRAVLWELEEDWDLRM